MDLTASFQIPPRRHGQSEAGEDKMSGMRGESRHRVQANRFRILSMDSALWRGRCAC